MDSGSTGAAERARFILGGNPLLARHLETNDRDRVIRGIERILGTNVIGPFTTIVPTSDQRKTVKLTDPLTVEEFVDAPTLLLDGSRAYKDTPIGLLTITAGGSVARPNSNLEARIREQNK